MTAVDGVLSLGLDVQRVSAQAFHDICVLTGNTRFPKLVCVLTFKRDWSGRDRQQVASSSSSSYVLRGSNDRSLHHHLAFTHTTKRYTKRGAEHIHHVRRSKQSRLSGASTPTRQGEHDRPNSSPTGRYAFQDPHDSAYLAAIHLESHVRYCRPETHAN
jgi:hypothetical protein